MNQDTSNLDCQRNLPREQISRDNFIIPRKYRASLIAALTIADHTVPNFFTAEIAEIFVLLNK